MLSGCLQRQIRKKQTPWVSCLNSLFPRPQRPRHHAEGQTLISSLTFGMSPKILPCWNEAKIAASRDLVVTSAVLVPVEWSRNGRIPTSVLLMISIMFSIIILQESRLTSWLDQRNLGCLPPPRLRRPWIRRENKARWPYPLRYRSARKRL